MKDITAAAEARRNVYQALCFCRGIENAQRMCNRVFGESETQQAQLDAKEWETVHGAWHPGRAED